MSNAANVPLTNFKVEHERLIKKTAWLHFRKPFTISIIIFHTAAEAIRPFRGKLNEYIPTVSSALAETKSSTIRNTAREVKSAKQWTHPSVWKNFFFPSYFDTD